MQSKLFHCYDLIPYFFLRSNSIVSHLKNWQNRDDLMISIRMIPNLTAISYPCIAQASRWFRHTSKAKDNKTAQRIASKEVLRALKENLAGKESCNLPAKRSKIG